MVLSGLMSQRALARTLLFLLSLRLICQVAAQPAAITGTMPEDVLPELKALLATALQQSPDVIAKEFGRMAAEPRLDIARAGLLPHVGGNFNYGVTQTATAADTSSKTRDSGFFYNFGV